jgi:hypothetical protein
MKLAELVIRGAAPLSFGKYHQTPLLPREQPAAYDLRTWRERLHYNKEGEVFIPPMAIKNCLTEAAAFLGMQIPGKGKSTYRKHFESGILVKDPVMLGIDRDKVLPETLFVPADGKRGSGKRVLRTFPRIEEGWSGKASLYILDDILVERVVHEHCVTAGRFIGLGRFRPANNGFYGRFEIENFRWTEL